MPKLAEVEIERHEHVEVKGLPWFSEAANQRGLICGGVYLLSGPPGSGKTTLALQVACDVAASGRKVLYVAMEQSASDVKKKVQQQVLPSLRSCGHDSGQGGLAIRESSEEAIGNNLFIDSEIAGVESLLDCLEKRVLPDSAVYSGVSLIVIDSIQGCGESTLAKSYQHLYRFCRQAKENGIVVILIGHVTKCGAIAGPRTLEHNVDTVLYLRKAMRLRPLFIPKNRFGPERHDPLNLVMNEFGCLEVSKHFESRPSQALGFVPGDLVEVQALVKLPKYGERPGLKAPFLPSQRISQLVGVLGEIQGADISDMTFEIDCSISRKRPYQETLDFPLAMTMLSSYLRCPIPEGSLFVGEVDLFGTVRMASDLGQKLAEALDGRVKRVYLPESETGALRKAKPTLEVHGVSDIRTLVGQLWPDAIERS